MTTPSRLALALLLAAPLLSLGACATAGANRPMAATEVAGSVDLLEIWGDEQRLQFSKQANLELPAKVAVADTGVSHRDAWDKPIQERRQVHLVKALEEQVETYSDAVSLTIRGESPQLTKDVVEDLRAEASQFQADLLVIARRRETVAYDTNALRIFNLLLLPMLFLPTESNDIEMSVRLAAVDVRNGLIYTTVDDQRTVHVNASVAGEDDAVASALDDLYAAMVADMRVRLATKLAGVAAP